MGSASGAHHIATDETRRPDPAFSRPIRSQPRTLLSLSKDSSSHSSRPTESMPGSIIHTVFWKWNGQQPADYTEQLRTAAQAMVGASTFTQCSAVQ